MTNPNDYIPRHLGLILDGNRRWAKEQGLPQLEGHRRGYENLKTIGIAAMERGVSFVSAFVFSTENWKRSHEEVAYLMKLLLWVAKHEAVELDKRNIRLLVLGSRERLSANILKAIDAAEKRTKDNTAGTLCLCLNYGGQQEIADAVKSMMRGGVKADDVNPLLLSQYMYQPEVPPIDLMIRTSGEQRISNFMLWRMAYAEMYFSSVNWPAFSAADLDTALEEYASRHRRFGS